jgi:hypothetical protein
MFFFHRVGVCLDQKALRITTKYHVLFYYDRLFKYRSRQNHLIEVLQLPIYSERVR